MCVPLPPPNTKNVGKWEDFYLKGENEHYVAGSTKKREKIRRREKSKLGKFVPIPRHY